MNINEKREIEVAQAQGDNGFPIGTKVRLKYWTWTGVVIGHHDGLPIIQPDSCTVALEHLEPITE